MRLGAALACCALLCGCGSAVFGEKNVEELLRAPRPNERQSAVQTALNAYLGETLQLKYPRGGSEPDPVLFADLDGDGAEEAAVLYTAPSKGQNVHLSVMEQDASGAWSVGYEVMGLSTEIAELQLVRLFDDSVQLMVGYANANLTDQYLEVYDYRDVTIYSACRQPYDACWLGTPAWTDGIYLALARATAEPGASELQLFVPEGRALAPAQSAVLDERLEKCTGVYPVSGGVGGGFLVDGITALGAGSQFLRLEDGALTPCADTGEDGGALLRERPRALAALTPRRLDDTEELAAPEAGASLPTLQTLQRFYPVDWVNDLQRKPLQQFGIYDAEYGCFFRLPEKWRGGIAVTAQAGGDWQIREADTGRLLCAVRVAEVSAANGAYIEAARLAEKKLLLNFGEGCTAAQAELIRRGVIVTE